jgi:AcrR family transcriptional regulator
MEPMHFGSTLRSLTAPLRLRKGDATRAAIVDAALAVARREGLEGLTIGALADAMSMSKSGVFAHFGSREELQLAVLNEYTARFVDDVLRPAVKKPRGVPRLQALLENWLRLLAREIQQGCLLIAGASEYDDRSGPLHDAMVRIVTGWKRELLRAIEQAREEGHVDRDVDAAQLVFEIYGLMLVTHQDARLLRSRDSLARARTALARLLASAGVANAPATTRARKKPATATERSPSASRKPTKPARASGAVKAAPAAQPKRAPMRGTASRVRVTK